MNRRSLLSLVLALVVMCSAPLAAAAEEGVAPARASVADIMLSGTTPGDHQISLDKGLTVFDYSITGTSSNFIVWLVRASDNTTMGLVANIIGDGSGTVALRAASAGEYRVRVTYANASWQVRVRQPRATSAPPTRSWSGAGESVSGLFHLSAGTYRFDGGQDGTSNFIVHITDQDGSVVKYLANEIGDDPVNEVFVIRKAGVYVLTVDADGAWNCAIESHYIPYRLTAVNAPRTAKAYSWFTVSVKLEPTYLRLTTLPVTMYAQRKSGSRWVGTVSARLSGTDYATYSLYRARLNVSRGTWRVWAQFKDAEHSAKKTGYKYVTVK